MSGSIDEELDAQAAEYALGVLGPQQARALEVLAAGNPVLAARLAEWERILSPLAELAPPASPPATLWRRLALASGIEEPVQARAARRGWDGWWKLSTAGMAAVAACLGLLLYTAPMRGTEEFASLGASGGPGATYLVRVGAEGRATVVAVGDTNVPQGRSLELWALKTGATVPVSMGLMPESGKASLVLPLAEGTKLLVSQEPQGGSPTKLPTGPVVYAGELRGL